MKPVQGDKKLVKKFKRAKDTIETKATKQAMRKSGNIVLKQARANLRPISRIMARALGQTPWGAFRNVALPLARPGIAVGVSLALMECLNDIGEAGFFGDEVLLFGAGRIVQRGTLDDLIGYLDDSRSPWHAAGSSVTALVAAGFAPDYLALVEPER